jgi:predicted nuclease of predicted toxin-antitoxin system
MRGLSRASRTPRRETVARCLRLGKGPNGAHGGWARCGPRGGLGRRSGDEAILARAHTERRVLITLDKDFGELAIVRAIPHSGIVRLVEIAATRQGSVSNMIVQQYGSVLSAGGIVTVEPNRVRVRSPEGES